MSAMKIGKMEKRIRRRWHWRIIKCRSDLLLFVARNCSQQVIERIFDEIKWWIVISNGFYDKVDDNLSLLLIFGLNLVQSNELSTILLACQELCAEQYDFCIAMRSFGVKCCLPRHMVPFHSSFQLISTAASLVCQTDEMKRKTF